MHRYFNCCLTQPAQQHAVNQSVGCSVGRSVMTHAHEIAAVAMTMQPDRTCKRVANKYNM